MEYVTWLLKEKECSVCDCIDEKHGIKKVITSLGGNNLELVDGLQCDGDFEIYSSVDVRSAAYMVCGLVGETNDLVAITCIEAKASRD